jgi:signal transduction histidine kinase
MRSLLVELRPETLTRAPLHELLQMLVAAVTAKSRLAVEAALDPVPLLPADVQVALYRIAQEALNNVARHAGASHLSVRLEATPLAASVPAPLLPPSTLAVSLEVADDGQGFVPAAAPRGRLGLASMGERAAGVGAALRLDSQPGAGTRVSVTWTGAGATPPGTSRSETAQGMPPAEPAPLHNGAADSLARLEEHAR